jgi:transposase-like protein
VVADVAHDFDVSGQTIYNWRRQDRNRPRRDTGAQKRRVSPSSRRRAGGSTELETELAATKRANELLRKVVPPKDRFAAIVTMVEEGHPAQTC